MANKANLKTHEPVPKPVVLSQALAVFQPNGLQNCLFFIAAFRYFCAIFAHSRNASSKVESMATPFPAMS